MGVFFVLLRRQESVQELSLQSEQARAEQLIDYFFNQPFVGMAIVAPGTQQFVKFNDQACVLTGYSHDELRTKTWRDITHPDDMRVTHEQVSKISKRETDAISYEQRLMRKDGSFIYINTDVQCAQRRWRDQLPDVQRAGHHAAQAERNGTERGKHATSCKT